MDLSDKIMLAVMAASLLGTALTRLADTMRARHDSALARLVGWAGRVAAEVGTSLSKLPAGADREAVSHALIASVVREGRTEFAGSMGIVGADDEALARMIKRELDKLPVARIGELVTGLVAPAPAAVPATATALAPAGA